MKTCIYYFLFILFISCTKSDISDFKEIKSLGGVRENATSLSAISKKLKLTTTKTSFITSSNALSGGVITNPGTGPITDRGVCYSTNPNPTILNSIISAGPGSTAFNVAITGLNPGTSYFVRAYTTNSSGTIYGGQDKFTTLGSGSAPFKLVYVSGNAQTYGGGGMPFPMVFRILNTATNTYVTNKFSDNLTISASASQGYEDPNASFSNYNDYCQDGTLECFGAYFYNEPNNSTPFTLIIKISLKHNGVEIDYYTLTANIIGV